MFSFDCGWSALQTLRILLLRFQTDPNIPGTEKLAISAIRKDLVTHPQPSFRPSDLSGDDATSSMLEPMSVFLVKGWTRSLCAIVCLAHCYENPDEILKAGPLNCPFCF